MVLQYSLAVFQEPRGMMRILQLIFAIFAVSMTAKFQVDVTLKCRTIANPTAVTTVQHIDYPFRFEYAACLRADNTTVPLTADVSSDAQFFVATGVLSTMYCVFIIAVYAFIDGVYKDKAELPLADFMITAVLALFWLSGAAAWSNGTNALKSATDSEELRKLCPQCEDVYTGNFSRLNISLLIGFLNFFLWTSDLWFLFKETIYFPGNKNSRDNAEFNAVQYGTGAGTIGDDATYPADGFNAQQQEQQYGGHAPYGVAQPNYGAPGV